MTKAMQESITKQEIIVAYLEDLVGNSQHFDVSSQASFRAILEMEKDILKTMKSHVISTKVDV